MAIGLWHHPRMDSSLTHIVRVVERAAGELLAHRETPGMAVSIVRGGQPVWSRGFGVADPFAGRETTGDSLFRIASVTKPFTATALLQLRDEGRLALHDPIVAHLPDVRAIGDPFGVIERITVGQMLLHTAGLPTDVPMADPRRAPGLTQDALLGSLHLVRLARPPDTHWHYSNLGYELLAILVAHLTGERYPDRLARTVLAPAGLADTTFQPTTAMTDRLAVGVLPGGRPGAWQRAPDHDSHTLLGDGGLWSSVDDLARWLSVQCLVGEDDRRGDGPRVLDGASLRESQRPLVLVDLAGWRSAQGPGWASFRIDETIWQGHTGSIAGFRAIALLRASDGLGVVALTNGAERPNPVAHAACRALLAAKPARVGRDPVPAAATRGPGPLGTWVNHEYAWRATITDVRGRLVLRVEGDEQPLLIEPTDDPGVWLTGGDSEDAGELVRHVPEAGPDLPEVLRIAGWPFIREA